MNRTTQARVAIVDDDEPVRDALSMMLRAAGYAVEAHASAEAFLAKKPPAPPACVVLDVRMPGMTGLELQERLADRGFDLPIVFLTGHGDIPQSVRAMRQGAVDYLVKPVSEAVLVAKAQEVLERNEGPGA